MPPITTLKMTRPEWYTLMEQHDKLVLCTLDGLDRSKFDA